MYLQTIESEKSLIYWEQNENKSNIKKNHRLYLKPFYVKFFEFFAKEENNYDFIKMWHKKCDEICNDLKKQLEKDSRNTTPEGKKARERIVSKFRGNLAEILIEAMIKFGKLNNYLAIEDYTPVEDPAHEEYIDGTGKDPNNKLSMGVQIKNFSERNKVEREVFDKAVVMSKKFAKREKNAKYNETCNQIIISFSDVSDTRFLDNTLDENGFKDEVLFIGPNEINSLNMGGNSYTRSKPCTGMFNEILEKISNL